MDDHDSGNSASHELHLHAGADVGQEGEEGRKGKVSDERKEGRKRVLRKEGKVRGAGGLWEPEKCKVCGLLLISLYQVCVCAYVIYRRCIIGWCPEQPVGGGRRQQAGVLWPAEDCKC